MNQPLTNPEFPTGDFVKGQVAAFERVYDIYYPGVLRFARELVQDPLVSATIVTDSFLKLWIQHAELDSPQNIEAFLHLSVQRSCFGYLRQVEELTPAQLKKMNTYYTEAPASQPSERTAASIRDIILGWFTQLPYPTSEVARLAYEEEQDDVLMAERLSMDVDQVKDQKLKGMLLIKEQWFSKTEKELKAFRSLLQKARE